MPAVRAVDADLTTSLSSRMSLTATVATPLLTCTVVSVIVFLCLAGSRTLMYTTGETPRTLKQAPIL